ncbi:26S proteasome regulatory subunit RPN7 [Cucumispora dikerogammari]|nr:26S proteasome regulatory subunit RPN7 [Cucumispora dikerogammari]
MSLKKIIKTPEALVYCKETGSVALYNHLIENDLIEENLKDLFEIKKTYESRLSKLLKETENDDNFKKTVKLSNFYAECINVTELEKNINENINENFIKMDGLLYKIRIAFIFDNLTKIDELFLEAEDLQKKCDWDRRNRFIVYNGLLNLIKGCFKLSADCFFESLATFNAVEIMNYETVGIYAIYSGILAFSQKDFKNKTINLSELIEMQNKIETAYNLTVSYSSCDYKTVYENLRRFIEENYNEPFLKKHLVLFERTVKFNLLETVLNSYSDVKLSKLAELFNIPLDLLESDLVNLIEERKLDFKIDGINCTVRATVA